MRDASIVTDRDQLVRDLDGDPILWVDVTPVTDPPKLTCIRLLNTNRRAYSIRYFVPHGVEFQLAVVHNGRFVPCDTPPLTRGIRMGEGQGFPLYPRCVDGIIVCGRASEGHRCHLELSLENSVWEVERG